MIALPQRFALTLAAAIAGALLLALLVHDRNRWKATAALRQQQVVAERIAHDATVANYRAAAEQARRKDAENLARAKAAQAAINERTAHDYESRIAAARADYERMLRSNQDSRADTGGGRAAPMPGLSPASGGAVERSGEDGFPLSDRLLATEQAIQLDELIKWVRAQSEVDVQGR